MQNFQAKNVPKKEHYFIYARKSSETEDRQVASIPDQLEWADKLISLLSLSIDGKPFTESYSAGEPGRTQFNRMADEIEKRDDIKGIVCWKFNRLSRNPKDEGVLRWWLQSGKIDEIITSDGTYKQQDSDFRMAIDGAQGQRFINDLRKDTLRGMKSKLDKGIAPILAPPGYKNDMTKRQGERDIIPDEVQFPLVRKLFELFMTKNYSVQQLWFEAEKLGVKNSRKQIVSKSQLYVMLRNPFYTGTHFIYAGKLYTNGSHKPLITKAEYDLIQDIMDGRSRPRHDLHAKDLLAGIMRCGECGRMITTEVKTKHYKNGTSQVFTYYRCTKKWNDKKCSQPYIRAEVLEEQVLNYMDTITLSTSFVEWAIKWLKVMHSNQEQLREAKYKTAEQSYQEVVKKINRVVEMTMDSMLTTQEGMERKQELELEKQRLSDELAKMDTHVTEWSNLAIQTFDLVKNIKERFTNGTIEQRKTILRVIGSNLVIKDKKIDIMVRTPFEYIQKAVSEINEGYWLEPDELPDLPIQIGILQAENFNWGGIPDSNRRPPLPQSGALTN